MSFIVVGEDAPQGPQNLYALRSERVIRVPPISRAVVPHGVHITPLDPRTRVLLMREPWAWAEKNLLIDTGTIFEGDAVVTRVFNLSSKEVTIKRGEIISYLMSVMLAPL